eukprot:PhM_4_TR18087/c0_g1_i1/m.106327
MYFFSLRCVRSGILSLSTFCSVSRNFASFIIFFAESQPRGFSRIVSTASRTIMTLAGGDVYAFVSLMSSFLREFRAASAASNAGMALSRSTWQSSLISFASFMMAWHCFSSFDTTSATSVAAFCSISTRSAKAVVSLDCRSSSGCSRTNSFSISVTISLVSTNLVSPPWNLLSCISTSCVCSSKRREKPLSILMYDVGVVYVCRRSSSAIFLPAASTVVCMCTHSVDTRSMDPSATLRASRRCATPLRAELGHFENQSNVMQFTREGNMRSRVRNWSPMGDIISTIWSMSRQMFVKKVIIVLRVSCLPAALTLLRTLETILSVSSGCHKFIISPVLRRLLTSSRNCSLTTCVSLIIKTVGFASQPHSSSTLRISSRNSPTP